MRYVASAIPHPGLFSHDFPYQSPSSDLLIADKDREVLLQHLTLKVRRVTDWTVAVEADIDHYQAESDHSVILDQPGRLEAAFNTAGAPATSEADAEEEAGAGEQKEEADEEDDACSR
jgi:hypothetical protein